MLHLEVGMAVLQSNRLLNTGMEGIERTVFDGKYYKRIFTKTMGGPIEMRRRKLWCMAFLLITLLLSGCGGGSMPSEESDITSSKEETKDIAGTEKENESSTTQQASPTTEPQNDKVLVKEEEYGGDGNLIGVKNYYYDQGNLVKEVIEDYSWHNRHPDLYSTDGFSYRYEYEYDSQGRRIKQRAYGADGNLMGWYEFERNDQGKMIKHLSYDSDGNLCDWLENEFDSQCNLIKSTSRYGWDEYEYNEQSKRIRKTSYSDDGSIERWEEYEYDDHGKLIKESSYFGSGNLDDWSEYEYNDYGNLIKVTEYDNEMMRVKEYSEYSGKDKVVAERVEYYGTGRDSEKYYTYDDMGNLQSKVTYDLWSYDGNAVLVSNKHIVDRVEYTYE